MAFIEQKIVDPQIRQAFLDLHKKLVNEIVNFCREYKIEANSAVLFANDLEDSIEFGEWHPSTDSSFELWDYSEEEQDARTLLYSV